MRKQKEFVSQSGFGLLPQEMAPPKFDSEPNFQALATVQTERAAHMNDKTNLPFGRSRHSLAFRVLE